MNLKELAIPNNSPSESFDIPNNSPLIEQSNSFKLIKNTKGYQWEIRIISKDPDTMLSKVKELNDLAIKEFGGYNESI